MSIDNPAALLVDVSGSLMAVTASLQIPSKTTGLIIAGVGGDGVVRYPNIDSNNALKVTGSVGIGGPLTVLAAATLPVSSSGGLLPVAIQSTISLPITGTVNLDRGNSIAVPLIISGAVGIGGPVTVVNGPGSLSVSSSGGTVPVAIQSSLQLLVSVTSSLPVSGTVNLDRGNSSAVPLWMTGTFAQTPVGIQQVTGSLALTEQVRVTSTGNLPVVVQSPVNLGNWPLVMAVSGSQLSGSTFASSPFVAAGISVGGLNQTGSVIRTLLTDINGALYITTSGTVPVNVVSGGSGAVQGFDLTGSTITANPVFVGYEARTSDRTAGTSGKAVGSIADTLGKQIVLLGSVHDLQRQGTQNYTTASGSILIPAAGSGVRIAVMSVLVTNAHATVSTKVLIKDGLTTKIQGYAVAAGGGFALTGGGVPLFITTANTAVSGGCLTSGADVDVTVSGYLIGN